MLLTVGHQCHEVVRRLSQPRHKHAQPDLKSQRTALRLTQPLELCQRVGRSRCSFAGADTPARFARLAGRLQARPLRLATPGVKATTFTYPNLIADTGHWLHDPSGYRGRDLVAALPAEAALLPGRRR
jgi:hypothetical protein